MEYLSPPIGKLSKIKVNNEYKGTKVLGYLGASKWHCKCSCDNECELSTVKILTGSAKCSECSKKAQRIIMLEAQKSRKFADSKLRIKYENTTISDRWLIGDYQGSQTYEALCMKCGETKNLSSVQIGRFHSNGMIARCTSCYPKIDSQTKIKVIDMLRSGYTGVAIAEQLKISPNAVVNIKVQAKLEGLISTTDGNADMSFSEIAGILHLSEESVRQTYLKAVKKVMKLITDMDDLPVPEIDETYRNYGTKKASKHTSIHS